MVFESSLLLRLARSSHRRFLLVLRQSTGTGELALGNLEILTSARHARPCFDYECFPSSLYSTFIFVQFCNRRMDCLSLSQVPRTIGNSQVILRPLSSFSIDTGSDRPGIVKADIPGNRVYERFPFENPITPPRRAFRKGPLCRGAASHYRANFRSLREKRLVGA